jgi:hypothetical protein
MTAAPAATASVVDSFRQQGWCALTGVMPRDTANLCRRYLYGMSISCGVIAQSYNTNLVTIPFYTRVTVIKDVPLFSEALVRGPLIDAVRILLGDDLCITSTTMVIEEPRTRASDWRRGEPFDAISRDAAQHRDLTHLMTVQMFSPINADNGGLAIRTEGREGMITGRLGDAAILDSRIERRVAANDGDLSRVLVYTGFARGGGELASRPRDPASILTNAQWSRVPAPLRPWFEHWRQR